jgi:hypothetical protein
MAEITNRKVVNRNYMNTVYQEQTFQSAAGARYRPNLVVLSEGQRHAADVMIRYEDGDALANEATESVEKMKTSVKEWPDYILNWTR